MRKVLLSFIFACMGLFSGYAGGPGGPGGDVEDIAFPLQDLERGDVTGIRPLLPPYPGKDMSNLPQSEAVKWAFVGYDPASSCLNVTPPQGIGPLLIILQNLTTGESYPYYFLDSILTIPIMGGDGVWRIYVGSYASHDHKYAGEVCFCIESGIIRWY